MSSFFSCLGKKSKAKKKKNGKAPEPKQIEDIHTEERDKEHPIEELIPAEKVNGQVGGEEDDTDAEPVQCTEDTEEAPLIKELKSRLSQKVEKPQTAEVGGDNPDERNKLAVGAELIKEKATECVSEIIEKSVIKSVGSEIGKIEANAKDSVTKKISKSDSSSETNYQLSEENKRLKRKCEESEKQIVNHKNDIKKLQEESALLRKNINDHTKLNDAIKERQDIMVSFDKLTDICSALKSRLDEVENKRENENNMKSPNIESKINSIGNDHEEISLNVKNTLKCVQELECRVINLELDEESENKKKDTNNSRSQIEQDQSKTIESLENQISALSAEITTLTKERKLETGQKSNDQLKNQLNHLSSLEKQVEHLNHDLSNLFEENTKLKEKLDHFCELDLESKCRSLESTVENQKREISKLSDENKKLKHEMTITVEKGAEKHVSKLQSLEQLVEIQNKELTQSREEMKNRKEQSTVDKTSAKDTEKIMSLQGSLESQRSEIEQLQKENQKLKDQVKTEQGEVSNLKRIEQQKEEMSRNLALIQGENKKLNEQINESIQSHCSKDEKLLALQNAEKDLTNTVKGLESKLAQYEARHKSETEELTIMKKKLGKIESQLREKEIAHQDTIKKLAEAQNKQEDIQKRLNAVANHRTPAVNGTSMTTSLSLSSEESPIKIGEQFRELYETVWRETFEKLHTVCRKDERKTLLILMEYLTECYLYCRRTARHQMDAVLSLLVSPTNMRGSLNKRLQGKPGSLNNIPPALKQNIVAFRRSPSEHFTESIFEEFMNVVDYQKSRHLRNIQARDITEVTPFVRKCMSVCWEMVTQEPPMYLLFKLRHNQIIEKNRFDVYSNDGNKVDFLVWPALLRDENGHLLQKGVVQAMRS